VSDRMWDLIYWAGSAMLVWFVICAVLALLVFGFMAIRFVRISREVDRHHRAVRERMDRLGRWP